MDHYKSRNLEQILQISQILVNKKESTNTENQKNEILQFTKYSSYSPQFLTLHIKENTR